jgi:branched-chain amino acid aminotransferase
MLPITITRTSTPKEKPKDESKLDWGGTFTDHMFLCDYSTEKGWHDARIVPYAPFPMDPACVVLHYSQTIFEGLKCYRRADGALQLFRDKDNFARLARSANRMGMPEPDGETFREGMLKLLDLEQDWVPRNRGTSLYIRPTMIAMDEKLGVHAADKYLFYIILSPVGAYHAGNVNIFVEDQYVRAVRGGVGEAKTGANYAASILAGKLAEEKGCGQVLWLDGVTRKNVEEVGSMNIFFVYGDTLKTPALNGSILPGITRDSVLKFAEHLGLKASEETIALDDVLRDIRNGSLTEAFGAGTAAVIAPVKSFIYQGETYRVGDGKTGKHSQKLYDTLTGIQWGTLPDREDWITRL